MLIIQESLAHYMWVDFLTKALALDNFEAYCENLGLQRFTTN